MAMERRTAWIAPIARATRCAAQSSAALVICVLIGLPLAFANEGESPNASPAEAQTASAATSTDELRRLLELLGVDESHFRSLMDGHPIQPDENEALLKLLFAVRRLPQLELRGTVPAALPLDLKHLPPKGSRVTIAGRLRAIASEQPPPELAERFELPRYYRCEVELADSQPAIVYVDVIPQAWQDNSLGDPRVGATGFLAKLASEAADTPTPVIVAPRLAWYPDSPLGELGMDFGLFDTLRQKHPLASDERFCFYEMLARLRAADNSQLASAATARLTPTTGGEIAKRLLQDPASESGKLVLLEGVARRAIRVEVTDPDIRRRYAIDHYFEVDLIFRDIRVRYEPAQANQEGAESPSSEEDTGPLVITCNLLELPPGMPTGDRISELVRVPAFFFKLWAFQSELAEQAGYHHLQFAPLFMARGAQWIEQPPAKSYTWVFSLLLVALLVAVVLVVWGMNRADRRRRVPAAVSGPQTTVDPAMLAAFDRGESTDAGR
ncbi:MAG: hypothetical protein K2Y37_05305 [Pirellulales bacterium]|nr:hypothetical protein [Pirellulales bacterium]